jgi:galactosyl transferase GMA12/MNN10 family
MYILTLVIGNDYRKALDKALVSKREYANKHGYTYIQGDESSWDRERPISWSKVPFLLSHLNKLPDGEIVWLSDADVYMTNMNLRLEDHVLPLLPEGKDMLMPYDACGHVNAGNLFMRNTPRLRDFWKRVYQQTDVIYHIWWENAGILNLMEKNQSDRDMIHVSREHKRFNAYLMGLKGEPLWEQGDLLVHFAGVYDAKKMAALIDEIKAGGTPRLSMF